MAMTFGTPVVGTEITRVVATKGTAGAEVGTFAHSLGVIPAMVIVNGLTEGSSAAEAAWNVDSCDATNVLIGAPTTTGTDGATAQITIFKTIHSLIG